MTGGELRDDGGAWEPRGLFRAGDAARRRVTLALLWAGVAFLFIGALLAERYQTGMVLVAPAALAGSVVVIAACQGGAWALKLCLIAYILTIDSSLRETVAGASTIDGQIMVKIVIMLAMLVAGLANLRASVRYYFGLPQVALLAYLLMAVVSTLYAPAPMITLRNAVGFISVALFAGALVARLEFREILATALIGLGMHVLLALGLAASHATPLVWMVTGEDGNVVRLKGLTGHALRMAEMAAAFVLCAWVMVLRNWLSRRTFIAVAVLGSLALVLTKERMPIFAFLVAMLSVGRFRPFGIASLVGITLATLVTATISPSLITEVATTISRTGNAREVFTLTGRLEVWRESLDAFTDRPFLGYGFASAGRVLAERQPTRPGIASPAGAEGVFTQSLVGMGLLGTMLLIVPFAYQIAFAAKHRDSALNPFIVYAFLSGLTTSSTIGSAPNTLTVFWIVALYLAGSSGERRPDAAFIIGNPRRTMHAAACGEPENQFRRVTDDGPSRRFRSSRRLPFGS